MTTKQWQLIAMFAMIAAFIALGVSLIKQTNTERNGKIAADSIDALTLHLDGAQALALAGLTAAQQYHRAVDSLRTHVRVDTVYARRQFTPVVIDTGDVRSVAAGIVTITAERDTAIIDRDSARLDVKVLKIELHVRDSLTIVHLQQDSSRFAQISATLDTVHTEAHAIRALVRPPWFRRWGGAIGRSAKVAGVAAIAFTLGRVR